MQNLELKKYDVSVEGVLLEEETKEGEGGRSEFDPSTIHT
jgi:hypothetical protein